MIKMASSSSPKTSPKTRRALKKRVISVPLRDIDGSQQLKVQSGPPSDSWAWRKYGQKPIKGSPYPRAYYRCSSSKGCPARKQVERSHLDPTVLVITYSSEHNHPWPPASRINHHHHRRRRPSMHGSENSQQPADPSAAAADTKAEVLLTSVTTSISNNSDDEKTTTTIFDLGEESFVSICGFKWFSDLESTWPPTSSMIESRSPVVDGGNTDGKMILSMREEDESLFADLGELPECSVVFRQRAEDEEEMRRRCDLAPCSGATG